MRALLLFLAVVATPVIAAQQPQPIVGKELAAFLGPVSPQAFRWQKYTMIDFEILQGEAKPPLAGHVSFYLGGHPTSSHRPAAKLFKIVSAGIASLGIDSTRRMAASHTAHLSHSKSIGGSILP